MVKAQIKKETIKIKCLKCNELKNSSTSSFYANNHPLFSTEKLEICKECILNYIGEKHKKNYMDRIFTVLTLLDKPFIITKWINCGEEWSKYITQMCSLPQNKNLKYRDSIFENEIIYKKETENSDTTKNDLYIGDINPNDVEKFYSKKWLGEYTESEINYLDDYYKGLDGDFKIVTTNHKDYAKKIAKASLHMDKCFEEMLASVSGADKKYKEARETFDTLSKSAQFSESQRGQNDVSLGCFGRVFDMVETKTYIPEHIVTNPDDIDKMIEDFKHIFKSI